MLMIRLQRVGRKHEPTFRLVLTESQNSTKSGRFLDILGSYDPRTDKPVFNAEKIKEWMGKGAKVTDTVHNLLINEKILSGKKINVLPRKSPPKKDEPAVEVVSVATGAPETVKEEAQEETPAEASAEAAVEVAADASGEETSAS